MSSSAAWATQQGAFSSSFPHEQNEKELALHYNYFIENIKAKQDTEGHFYFFEMMLSFLSPANEIETHVLGVHE
ncbi:hypothetical protein SOL52_10625 [Lactobacillus helveticus]|uniref:hypothetical protein n=1 Tax=Lactobacillus helveticus TaxID=1587 RepID=UPI002A6B6A1E|nr:hypothetical protein [Lactobacillus helveticus]MDY0876328.1 hypothetical protein [Lactobacillus helveticus]MDY0992378.1 hypothetical protein [Lactobacillus helveticus]MDY1003078.1 hypothetical protein [Lactobacillus helveticus]